MEPIITTNLCNNGNINFAKSHKHTDAACQTLGLRRMMFQQDGAAAYIRHASVLSVINIS